MSSQHEPPIAMVPIEIFLEISRLLDVLSLSRFAQTCRSTNNLLRPTLMEAAKAGVVRLPFLIEQGCTKIVRSYLLVTEFDPNSCCLRGKRMLNIAIKNTHYDMMCVLLAYGANPSLPDISYPRMTPLMHAISAHDHFTKDITVQRLAAAGADMSPQGTIHEIARYCNLDTLKLAKLYGADFYQRDASGSSILDYLMNDYIRIRNHDAYRNCNTSGSSIMGDDMDKLEYILHEARDIISAVDENNKTPLFTAIRKKDQDFACAICDVYLKSDPSLLAIRNRNGDTALHLAILYGMENLFMKLIESGLSLHNIVGLETALSYVMNSHSVPILRHLFEAGADADCHLGRVDQDSETPLFAAIRTRDQKFAFTICDVYLKSDPSLLAISNKNGDTVLHLAIFYGMKNLFMKLIESGIISLHNVVGLDTALDYVMHSYSIPILRHLIAAGADVNRHIGRWATPLKCAVLDNKLAFVRALVEFGKADLSAIGSENATGSESKPEFESEIGFLFETRSETEIFSKRKIMFPNETPLKLAERYRHTHIAEYLRSKGAK